MFWFRLGFPSFWLVLGFSKYGRPKVFCQNDGFKGFTKFVRKHLRQNHVLKKRRTADWLKRNFNTVVSLWVFKKTPILKNFRKWLLTNLFYEIKPPAPKGREKITAEVFFNFDVAVPANTCASLNNLVSQQPYVPAWSLLTDQISIFCVMEL